MAKKRIEKPQRELTHRQLTHWQKQQRLQRIVLITGIVLIVAIIAVIGTGLYFAKIKPAQELSKKLQQVVLKIDNTTYDLDYLTDAMSFMMKTYQSFGLEPNIQYLATYSNAAVQSTEGNFLVVEAASKLTVPLTVSDDEVTKYIKDNELSDKQFTKDSVLRQLLIEKIQADYFSPQIPATTEHRAVWAMLLESQAQATAVKDRISKGETFPDIAAELSLDKTTKDKKGDLGWLPKGILASTLSNTNASNVSILENKIFNTDIVKNELATEEDPTLSKNIGYWLVKATETIEADNQTHVYAMLLGNLQQAEDIKAKLTAGGEGNDWATLAKANSQWDNASENGGDLGNIAKGTLGSVVDSAIFDANGKPIIAKDVVTCPLADTAQTTNGAVWLIQVNGIEEQTTSDANRTTLIGDLFNDWFTQYSQDNLSRFVDEFNDELQQFAFNEALKR